MSETELIAAAQVVVSAPNLSLVASKGIKTATRVNTGIYELELKEEHHTDHWIASATRLATGASLTPTGPGEIAVAPVDKTHVQVLTFDSTGVAADASFYFSLLRLGDC